MKLLLPITRNCRICGHPFTPNRMGMPRRYCGKRCYRKAALIAEWTKKAER